MNESLAWESIIGQDLEIVLLWMEGGGQETEPTVWITARDLPFTREQVTIAT